MKYLAESLAQSECPELESPLSEWSGRVGPLYLQLPPPRVD